MSAESGKCQANVYAQLNTFARDLDSSSAVLGGTSLSLPQTSLVMCYYQDTAVIQIMCRGKGSRSKKV